MFFPLKRKHRTEISRLESTNTSMVSLLKRAFLMANTFSLVMILWRREKGFSVMKVVPA